MFVPMIVCHRCGQHGLLTDMKIVNLTSKILGMVTTFNIHKQCPPTPEQLAANEAYQRAMRGIISSKG